MLNYYGKLLKVNSLITSLPMYFLSTNKIPAPILEQVDKHRMHGLWNGGEITKKVGCLVAWKKVTRPKEEGGLGIIDLKVGSKTLQNDVSTQVF